MDVLHPRCAVLDVHKHSVVAAVRLAEPGGARSEVRRFDTTTPGLLALGDWPAECGCTHAVMEATGVYWKPVWHVLSDDERVLILANAAHVKNVPSPAPRLSGTPRRRTVSAGGVDDGGRNDGCGRSWPGRADVAAAQAGRGAAPAARCGPGYGVAGVPGPRGAAHLLAGTPLGPRAGGIAAGSEM